MSWWQGTEAAGHIASIVRKQKEVNAGIGFAIFLFSLKPQLREWYNSQSVWLFLPKNSLTDNFSAEH